MISYQKLKMPQIIVSLLGFALFFVCLRHTIFLVHKQIQQRSQDRMQKEREYFDYVNHSKQAAEKQEYKIAVSYAQRALKIKPNDVSMLLHLGFIQLYCSNLDAAQEAFAQAISNDPQNPVAHYNHGYITGLQLCQVAPAIESLKKAVALKQNYIMAHTVMGELFLMAGEFEKAWPEFGWNWDSRYKPGQWNEVSLQGKKVVLYDVLGLGDSVHLIRYLKLLKEKGATTILYTHCKALIQLYKQVPYIDEIFEQHNALPEHDLSAPLMALPLLFNTTVKTIPSYASYIYADQKLVSYWKTKLAKDRKFKVGLVWHSEQSSEVTKPMHARKSIPLKDMQPLLNMQHISFYSLQKFDGVEEIDALSVCNRLHVLKDLDTAHGSFMDTAALIANMDLIISCDTAAAHLAGAMGKPVWLLTTFPADWRWMLERFDSPWYPTMKIFRRQKDRGWGLVMEQVSKELEQLVGG